MNFKDTQNRLTNVLYCDNPTQEGDKVTYDRSVMEETAKDLYTANRLAEAYIEATEWNFATLDRLLMAKRTPKHETRRQIGICTKMLTMCLVLRGTDLGRTNTRVRKAFEAIDVGKNPEQAVQAYVDANTVH